MLPSLVLLLSATAAGWSTDGLSQQTDTYDDPVLPLVPQTARTEREQLRIVSGSWYAEGRLFVRRREFPQALRCFQRAWRYNPDAEQILPQIVILAFQLRRPEVAGRYILLMEDPAALGSALLRQLALQHAALGQTDVAIRLFEASLPAGQSGDPPQAADDLGTLLMHLELGRLYFLADQFEKSADSFEIVREAIEHPERLEKNPALKKALLDDPARTYRTLAESFLQAGRFAESEAMFRKALAQPEQSGLLSLQLARIAARQGNTTQGLDHLEQVLEASLEGVGSEPYRLLTKLLEQQAGDRQAGRQQIDERLEELIRADETNVPLRFFVANRYLQDERFDDALRHLESLQIVQPAVEVLDRLVDIYRRQDKLDQVLQTLGLAVVRTGSLDALEVSVASIVEDEPLVTRLLELAARPSEDGEAATERAGKQLAAAWLALLSDRFDQAHRLFDQALQTEAMAELLASQPRPWLAWGLQCLISRQYEQAATAMQRAAEAAEEDNQKAFAAFYGSRALALAGDTEQAMKLARKAAQLQPDTPRLQAQTGWVDYYAKRYRLAIKQYEDLIARFDDQHQSSELRDVMRDARLILSAQCIQLGDREQAEEWLEQVLDEFPEDIGALNDFGYLWAEDGKYLTRALEMIQRAIEAEPDNSAYRDSLGWAYYQLGDFNRAVRELEQASEVESPDGVILDHLGDAYLKAGQIDKAIRAWRRAVKAMEEEQDQPKRKATQQKIKTHRR